MTDEIPTPEAQIAFLSNLQRLLAEGQFVATYKFALLLAIADLALKWGEDDGRSVLLHLDWIAEKFVFYYWGQVKPFVPAGQDADLTRILSQNTGRQAVMISAIVAAQSDVGRSIADAKRAGAKWTKLIKEARATVLKMPLWRLQNVGDVTFDFLYPDQLLINDRIQLRPGVAFCLRRFHSLVVDLVKGAWLSFVWAQNLEILGTAMDLEEFLFGTKRRTLDRAANVLAEIQNGRCFYCAGSMGAGGGHVDHFIPWSRYAVDLGHNFVLAHANCNLKKSNHISAVPHLERWFERNRTIGQSLGDEMGLHGFVSDFKVSLQVTKWAYEQAERIGERGWVKGDSLEPIGGRWRDVLGI